jgi:cytochrome c553
MSGYRKRVKLAIVLAVAGAFFLRPGPEFLFHALSQDKEVVSLSDEELKLAASGFEAKCAVCHGKDGKGFDVRTNLSDQVWHHGSQLADIQKSIREGVAGTLMKPQKDNLTPEQISQLARYVKHLAKMKHATTPESNRQRTTKLTDEVAARLPQGPKIDVKENENLIDRYIFGKMKADRIPHAGLSSDAEFMRRVYLDLWGRLPDTDPKQPVQFIDLQVSLPNRYTVQKFVADPDPDKRNKLIDHLLGLDYEDLPASDESERKGPWLVGRPFVSKWTLFFANLFRSADKVFQDHLYNVVKYNVPYDYVVRDLLTATSMFKMSSGPAGFLLRYEVPGVRDTDSMHEDTCDEMAIGATKIFTGVNLECISCHDGAGHLEKINLSLSKKKRIDFWRQAAFFGNLRIGRPGQDTNLTLIDGPPLPLKGNWKEEVPNFVFTSKPTAFGGPGYRMEAPSVLRPPRDKNAQVYPQYFSTGERPAAGVNPRVEFARMLTSDLQFAKATVNLIWSEFMTVGIVDPPFDWDLDRQDPKNPPPPPWTIQPSHPQLLEALAKDFQRNNYDLRYLMRTICRSKAYQLSSRFEGEYKPEYDKYYARKLVRRLSAEEIYDAIAKATNVFGHGVEYVMDQIATPDAELVRFLDFFGRSNRSTTQASNEGSPLQASIMLNSEVVKRKVLAITKGSRVSTLLTKMPPPSNEELVRELYLSALSRYPTAAEEAESVKHIETYRDKGLENLQWALLNKIEFLVNY